MISQARRGEAHCRCLCKQVVGPHASRTNRDFYVGISKKIFTLVLYYLPPAIAEFVFLVRKPKFTELPEWFKKKKKWQMNPAGYVQFERDEKNMGFQSWSYSCNIWASLLRLCIYSCPLIPSVLHSYSMFFFYFMVKKVRKKFGIAISIPFTLLLHFSWLFKVLPKL